MRLPPTAKEELLRVLDPLEYYRALFPEWSGRNSDNVSCIRKDRHKEGDSSPSLSLDPATGAYFCHGCGLKGTSVVGFEAERAGSYKAAIRGLYAKYVRPIVGREMLTGYRQQLSKIRKGQLRHRLTAARGWSVETQKLLHLGWNQSMRRVVIPIYNASGYPIDLRFHDSLREAPLRNGKRVGTLAPKGGRKGDWFPLNPKINPFKGEVIWLVEGEPDAILATQDSLNCVTVTGGVESWASLSPDRLGLLEGKHVAICFDSDNAGNEGARKLAEKLATVDVASLKIVFPPLGNDITEFFLQHGGSAQQLRQCYQLEEYLFRPKAKAVGLIPLHKTSEPQFIGKELVTNVLVNGKDRAPLAIPKRVRFECKSQSKCHLCPCGDNGFAEHVIMKDDPSLLGWVNTRDYAARIRADLGLGRCSMAVDVIEWQSVERCHVIPALTTRSSENVYVAREAYYLGHGLEGNQNYRVKATPVSHPTSHENVLMISEAEGTHDSLEGFKLSKEEVEELRAVFEGNPGRILREVARVHSANNTRIYGRSDLHVACDLAFHSPSEFVFAGDRVTKGSMELVLFGDTRCGKGQVAEGLVRAYDLGAVVSGENASFMGLVGGAQKSGGGFALVWGRIPTNHRRLVCVDEFSGFSDLGRMSRIRSEGIAEIDKGGIHASTGANTRLVWIANPRKGRDLASFGSGAEALADLVQQNEDIARFDLAIAVAKNEVSLDTINRNSRGMVETPFTNAILRRVVLWAWSRREDHVQFTKDCEEYIFKVSKKLAEEYSSSIPLVQGENIRFKIAKIAAAVAARCFSTPDGEILRVQRNHALTAVKFIRHVYDKPAMGYGLYSRIQSGRQTLDIESLEMVWGRFDPRYHGLIADGLLSMSQFTPDDLQDWTGEDRTITKGRIADLVQCNAIYRNYYRGGYVKSPQFTDWLKAKKEKVHGA